MTAELEDRVEAGAEYLDKHFPGWEDRINVATLSLINCQQCVLGQLTGHYAEALAALPDVKNLLGDDEDDWARDHAFSIEDAQGYDWNDMTVAWKELIARRRIAKTVANVAVFTRIPE